MAGLGSIDLAVIVLYLVVTTALGVWLARRVKNMGDFFMPRRFGKAMLIMHSFGTATHSDQAVIVASKSYTSGLSGIWYQWLWLFVTPFYWMVAVVLRRTRAITIADMVEARFDRSVSLLYTCVAVLHLTVAMGLMLKGSSEVVSATCGGVISAEWAIALMTILFVIYGCSGGLAAAIVTDFIQGMLTIFFSFLLLPYVLDAVGGLSGLHAKINQPEMFSLVAPGDISVFYVSVISLNVLIGCIVMPNMMGVCGSSKTELDSRVGMMGGNFVKRICTMAWCLTGLAAVAYYAGQEVHPDEIYGRMAREFLPSILPGALGLFLAALLAAVTSTCDSFMINCSALLTENVYKRLRPQESQRHYVWVGRIAAASVVGGGLLVAFWLPSVVKGIELLWKIVPMVGVAFWLGFFWRRMTVAGAWAAVLTGFAVLGLTSQSRFVEWLAKQPINEHLALVTVPTTDSVGHAMAMSLPWQMLSYLSLAAVVGIVVSLVSKPVNEAQLDRFFALVRTPVVPGEVLTEPCCLPEGTEPAPRRNLLPLKSIELPVPSLTTIIGFLVGWLLVAAMIGGFYWLTQV